VCSSILIVSIFMLAAVVQRISGIGFSLVALPLLLPVIGPLDGVALIIINSAITSLLMTIGSIKDVAWKPLLRLSIPSMTIAFPTIMLLYRAPISLVNFLVGVLLIACTLTLVFDVKIRRARGLGGEIVVGLVSGFMNATAGVAGPAIGAYSTSVGWSHRTFVATAQPYFIMSDVAVLAAKFVFRSDQGENFIDLPQTVSAVFGCVVGLLMGSQLYKWVRETVGRWSVIVVSGIGAVTTLAAAILDVA